MSKDGFTKKDRDLIISIATKVDQVEKRVTKLEKSQEPEAPEKPEDINGFVESPFSTIHNGPDFVEIGFVSPEGGKDDLNRRSIMASSIYEALRDMCRTVGINSIKLEITL